MSDHYLTASKSGLIAGLVYAALCAGFDYAQGMDFRLLRFFLSFIGFGIFMALLVMYNLKKKGKV